jgi:hypothetical protein
MAVQREQELQIHNHFLKPRQLHLFEQQHVHNAVDPARSDPFLQALFNDPQHRFECVGQLLRRRPRLLPIIKHFKQVPG